MRLLVLSADETLCERLANVAAASEHFSCHVGGAAGWYSLKPHSLASCDILFIEERAVNAELERRLRRVREANPQLVVVALMPPVPQTVTRYGFIVDDFLAIESIDTEALERLFRLVSRARNARSVQEENGRQGRDTDPVTGLLNQSGVCQRFAKKRALGAAEHYVAIVNLDAFADVNSCHGHSVGDLVLRESARAIRESSRAVDIVGRVGGDVFVALLEVSSMETAAAVADRVRARVSQSRVTMFGEPVSVSATVVIMRANRFSLFLDHVLARAKELSQQVATGDVTLIADNPAAGDDVRSGAKEGEIAQLSDGASYYAVAQQIVSIADGGTVGYELLSRTTIAGYESPDLFFDAARRNSMTNAVDSACLRACLRAGQYLEGRIHVNVLPSTLLSLTKRQVTDLLDLTDPRRVTFEMCEQQIVGNPGYLLPAIKQLRDAGARIAIDDVGFGKSYLEALVEIRPDEIKIDRIVVNRAAQHLGRYAQVARALGAEVTVEGIETTAHMTRAIGAGIKLAQGFLWGMPQTVQRQRGETAPLSNLC